MAPDVLACLRARRPVHRLQQTATDVEDTEPKDSEVEDGESELEGVADEDGSTDAEKDADEDTEGDADELQKVMHDFIFHLGETVRVLWPRLDE